jgi:hypothetical protein
MADRHDKIIKEGGYQPTQDPPSRPPASVVRPAEATPAAPPAPKPAEGSRD